MLCDMSIVTQCLENKIVNRGELKITPIATEKILADQFLVYTV